MSDDRNYRKLRAYRLKVMKPTSTEEVNSHWSKYGEVLEIRNRSNSIFSDVCVQGFFRKPPVYRRFPVIGHREEWTQIENSNRIFNANASSISAQPEGSKLSIFSLNNDILREIFRRVDLFDLCSIADVCTRFSSIAKDVFPLAHNVSELDLISENGLFGESPSTVQIETFCRNFGTFLTSFACRSKLHLDFAKRYCSSGLKKLVVMTTDHPLGTNDLAVYSELEILRLNDSWFENTFTAIRFPKLLELHTYMRPYVRRGLKFEFIRRNKNLRKISINCMFRDSSELRELLHVIEEESPQLTQLRMCIETERTERRVEAASLQQELKRIANFGALKALELNCETVDSTDHILPLIQDLVLKRVPLQRLSLTVAILLDVTHEHICNLKLLEVLEINSLRRLLTDEDLIGYARELPKLRVFKLTSDSSNAITTTGITTMIVHANRLSHLYLLFSMRSRTIQTNEYNTILRAIQRRDPQQKLHLAVTGLERRVLRRESRWLSIENLRKGFPLFDKEEILEGTL